jgi:thymidine phosphorylase
MVAGIADGAVPDYQWAALLLAIVWRGMDEAETAALTDAMLRSGTVVDLSGIPGGRSTSTAPAASATRRRWSWRRSRRPAG